MIKKGKTQLKVSLIKSLVILLWHKTKTLVNMAKLKDNPTLTKAEMEVMNYLWDMPEGGGTVRDVLACYPEPLPAYTTTATFLKILTQKGFVRAEKRENAGKTLFFCPVVSRDAYRRKVMTDVKDSFFGGSAASLVNFFVKDEAMSEDEIRELMSMLSE